MSITGVEITDRHITFCVREHEGKPVQHLTITPVGFIDYGDSRWRTDYVMVEIRLVVLRSQIVVDEHATVGSLVDLHKLLLGFQEGVAGSGTFGTVDGQLEMTVEWREPTQDVRFAGRIPAFDYTELAEEPLRLQDGIYRVLTFEFALELTALVRPMAQLQDLLELLRSLKAPAMDDI